MSHQNNINNTEQDIDKPVYKVLKTRHDSSGGLVPSESWNGVADTVLMIEPVAFGYNPETAVNNYFQKKDNEKLEDIAVKALAEFKNMVELLTASGMRVVVVKDTEYPPTPDSIFPNNWISFHEDGRAVLYPMFAPNRRLERRMDVLLKVENETGRKYKLVDYSTYELQNQFLEGTGSLVLDRKNRIAYASLSERTDKQLLELWCDEMKFTPVSFTAVQQVGNELLPIYHTNVMMCVCDELAVVCTDTIRDENERLKLIASLTESSKKIVEISEEQMHRFAGNMIQLKNSSGEKFILMSQTAHHSLNESQLNMLQTDNKLIVAEIHTIEKYGGGGVRCMVAEIF